MSTPLATVGSIKVKLGLLVAASVLVAMVVSVVGYDAGVPLLLAFPVTVALALAVTQLLAVGMTSPLREMTEAARRMARGDYRGRVRAESADEVGELARAFNQMATELDTVDQEQRALVATVSHELRTPLAGLTAVLENLADGVVPADEAHLQAAVGQARRLSDLVGDLLELSRVDAGVAPLRLADVDVAELLDETVAELVPTGRAVSFAVDVADGLTVRADRARLRQLVVNLLDNAVRHGPDHGTVRVRATTDARTLAARDRRRRSGRAVRRPRTRVRAVRHPRPRPEQHGRRRHRPRARHRPLGGHAARRHRPLRRPPGRDHGRRAPPRPAARPARASGRRPGPGTRPRLGGRHVRTRTRPGTDRRRRTARGRPALRPVLARRTRLGPARGAGRARRGRAGRAADPVPRPGPGVLPRAARGRGDRVVGGEAPDRAVHGHLPDAGGPVHVAGRAAGRRVDRRPVPARGHGQPGGRGDRRAPAGRVRGRRGRVAALRAARPAVARPQRPWCPRVGPRPSRAPDRAVVGGGGAGLRPPVRVRGRRRRRLARRPRPGRHGDVVRAAGLHRGLRRRRNAGRGVPRPQPPGRLRRPRRPRLRGRAPLRVAGAGAARRPGVRGVRGRPGGGAVRRSRLRPAHHRSHLRRVRAPGLRPAHRRHPADVPRGLGGLPPGRPRAGGRPLAPHLARPALRAHPGGGRLGPAPDAAVPGGVRLHPGPPGGRRVRGLARRRRAGRGPLGRRPLGRLGAAVRADHRRGRAARHRRGQPRRPDRPPQHREVRGDRQDRRGRSSRPCPTTPSRCSRRSSPSRCGRQALGGRDPYDDDWLAWNLGRWRAAEYLVVE